MRRTTRHAAAAAQLIVLSTLAAGANAQFMEADAVALHIVDGEGGGYAWAVSELADIDGDGAGDWITGAPSLATAAGNGAGRLYVYSGATAALLYSFDGPLAASSLGYSMADAGDADGDGVHDIIGGAKGSQGGTSPGNAYVYSGADGAVLLHLTGTHVGEGFGHAVAGIGDVNDDGHDDLLVGAPGYDQDGNANLGRGYVFSGADGSLIRTHNGPEAADAMGSAVSGVGDINGDGVADYAVTARRGGPSNRGSCFVFSGADGSVIHELLADDTGSQFGQFFVGGPGDVDADGTPDVYVGDYGDSRAYVFSGADGSQLLNLDYPGGLGCGRGAGDVNGDGHADLAVGAYTYNSGNGTGRIYIFSGCDGSVLRTITSDRGSNEQLGFDAVGMADTDGDGLPEILGAAGNGNRVYVIKGNFHPIPDVNGDGLINTQDVIAFLNAWAAGDLSVDFTGDGQVNTQDVLEFLNRWNEGC